MPKLRYRSLLIICIFTICFVSACKNQLPCPAGETAQPVKFFPVALSQERFADAPDLRAADIEGFLRERVSGDGGSSSANIVDSPFFKLYLDESKKQYKLSFEAQVSQIAAALSGSNTTVTTTTTTNIIGGKTAVTTVSQNFDNEELSIALK